jgi:hypothetical protein
LHKVDAELPSCHDAVECVLQLLSLRDHPQDD